MTDREREIQARCEAATPGPWKVKLVTPRKAVRGGCNTLKVVDQTTGQGVCVFATKADSEFIAHAREDVPYLQGVIDGLRAELEAMTKERDTLREQINRQEHEFEALITEREHERDAAQRRADDAVADLKHIAQEMFTDNSDDLRGAWYSCEVCKKYDDGNDCYDCLAASYDESKPGTAFEWRGDAQEGV